MEADVLCERAGHAPVDEERRYGGGRNCGDFQRVINASN
jgi:hypothetical protein